MSKKTKKKSAPAARPAPEKPATPDEAPELEHRRATLERQRVRVEKVRRERLEREAE